jgi:hypothetical protein
MENIGKEAAVTYFKILSQHLFEVTQKSHGHLKRSNFFEICIEMCIFYNLTFLFCLLFYFWKGYYIISRCFEDHQSYVFRDSFGFRSYSSAISGTAWKEFYFPEKNSVRRERWARNRQSLCDRIVYFLILHLLCSLHLYIHVFIHS